MAELSGVKLTWEEAQNAAQNRDKWRGIVVANFTSLEYGQCLVMVIL